MSPDRAAQLRNLAQQDGTSINGAVAKLFRALHAHTDVEHSIPSVQVNALADGLAIQLEGNKATGFGFTATAQVAETIRAFLAGNHAGEKVMRFCPIHGGTFTIWRKGGGVKIAIPAAAPEKNFSVDLLEDFADILEREIAKAKS
jgi:hypothetical protein